ncbi:MAG TPA: S8 family serine peptidase, partial [Candidatus Krumholzibacteria bacterium]|nr:S8 family serine peptidase [Candidatus Krumholzibacteria bacterium]
MSEPNSTSENGPWIGRTLVALSGLDGSQGESELVVIQEVAVRFADRFAPEDRVYGAREPRWHEHVREALRALRDQKLVRGAERPALTKAGNARAAEVRDEVERERPPDRTEGAPAGADTELLVTSGVISQPLRDPSERRRMDFPSDDDTPMPVMVELNLKYAGGPGPAFRELERLWVRVTGGDPPSRLAGAYATGELTMNQMKRLVSADAAPIVWSRRSTYRIWPDFPVKPFIDASGLTIKADAARRAFNASGDRIVWAVVDSGVDETHGHFASYQTLSADEVRDLHRTFPTNGEPVPDGALVDELGHGTHVAGIIAGGGIDGWLKEKPERELRVTENRYNVENPREPLRVPRTVDPSTLTGMAPRTRLVSLKVLHGGGSREQRVSRIIKALAYVREVNAQSDKVMRIHGVNLSVGYEFDAEWFACGQSPLCQEVDKLVRSGVVVVTAAGNSGYGEVVALFEAPTKFGLPMTINDPGNADGAITVGATHRDMPHTYGVSYFSSKGPTGDGRRKPDLVAPGERITSCAAGAKRDAVIAGAPETAVYVESSGTSMAAPHV